MMRSNLVTCLILTVAWLWVCGSGVVVAGPGEGAMSTHPIDYATVHEVQRGGHHRLIRRLDETKTNSTVTKTDSTEIKIKDPTITEIDDRSLIAIKFDEAKMRKPDNGVSQVKIGIEAFQTKNGDRDQIPVPKYTSRQGSAEGTITFEDHDRPYEPDQGREGRVPNTIIDPGRLIEKDVDQIEIRIINRKTRERTVYYLRLRELGFRAKIRDTFMFIKRRGAEEPLDPINFAPVPGVTFGTTWFPRERNTKFFNTCLIKPIRALHPGLGLNASIMKWNDPALKGTRLNVGLGVQVSLFNNIIMGTYGVNLQAEHARWYYGIGISFLQLNGAISGND